MSITPKVPPVPYTSFELDNGLRAVHCPNTQTAMVGVNVVYDTGARDERPDRTGLAHLFEHAMFGGSRNVADFDAVLTAAGGENNAATGNDFTTYYAAVPAHNAETLFYVESDRMLCPALSQQTLDVQRRVVIEEFKQQCLNRPYGDTYHHLRPLLYGDSHPYSWPVIGKEIAQIEAITRQDLLDWYTDHYAPGNAVLAITGNITADRARRLTEKWFGGIEPRTVPRRTVPTVTAPTQPRTAVVTGHVPATSITMAYLMDPYGTDGYLAADAITDVLSAGPASRFYRQLIVDGKGWFTDADACISGNEHQGMLLITARLANEDIDPDDAIAELTRTARTVITDGVCAHDMQRLFNRQLSNDALARMDYMSYGQRLAMSVIHGEAPDSMLRRYLHLTADNLIETADKIFNHSAPAIVIYRPA